jgi:hypothetical protein
MIGCQHQAAVPTQFPAERPPPHHLMVLRCPLGRPASEARATKVPVAHIRNPPNCRNRMIAEACRDAPRSKRQPGAPPGVRPPGAACLDCRTYRGRHPADDLPVCDPPRLANSVEHRVPSPWSSASSAFSPGTPRPSHFITSLPRPGASNPRRTVHRAQGTQPHTRCVVSQSHGSLLGQAQDC